MKTIIAIIILISLSFSISALDRHIKPEQTITYKDIKILGGVAIINIILLVAITLLFIFT